MLKLYDFLASGNGYKVRLVLATLGIPYERIELDITQGETRSDEFLQRNANGRIPTLQLDDGTCLSESNAIQWYLSEGTRLLPEDRFERAKVLQWMFFEQYSHEPFVAVVRFWIHQGLTQQATAGSNRRKANTRLRGLRHYGAASRWRPLLRWRPVVDRRHRALCIYPCGPRGASTFPPTLTSVTGSRECADSRDTYPSRRYRQV